MTRPPPPPTGRYDRITTRPPPPSAAERGWFWSWRWHATGFSYRRHAVSAALAIYILRVGVGTAVWRRV